MRVLLRPSEATLTIQNLWPLESKLGDSSYGYFSKLFPFGVSLCIWGTAYRTVSRKLQFWVLYVYRTWSSDSYSDVHCIRVATRISMWSTWAVEQFTLVQSRRRPPMPPPPTLLSPLNSNEHITACVMLYALSKYICKTSKDARGLFTEVWK